VEPFTATSLDDLAEGPVAVTVRRADGRAVVVPMQPVTEDEVFRLRLSITWPKPPIKDLGKVNGVVTPTYNFEDEGYLKAQREAGRRQTYLVLLRGLAIDVPGATDDEKIAALQSKLGNSMFTQLLAASNQLNTVDEGELAAVANSFRPGRTAGAEGGHEAQPDALAVVGAAQA
jgi:hypothetical protein